jgi:putative toxin-antitoxin system antitoxin component (TIGR02293 family)
MIPERKRKSGTYDRYDTLVNNLGRKYIHGSVESSFDFIRIARDGVNAQVIRNFSKYFRLTRDRTAKLLQVSEPTIYRWTREEKLLDKNYSVQLFELADLFLYGEEVFQSREHFFKWTELPNVALGGMEPLQLLEVPGGISKVRYLLGRIQYGVYS